MIMFVRNNLLRLISTFYFFTILETRKRKYRQFMLSEVHLWQLIISEDKLQWNCTQKKDYAAAEI
jgi:hypothetical protein